MRIQIGTRVKFLNDVGGGVVCGFADEKYAIVETDDGFEMPVLLNELLLDSASPYEGKDAHSATMEPEATKREERQKSVVSFEDRKYVAEQGDAFLAIVPQNDQLLHVSNFEIHLINDSNYAFNYCISFKDSGVSTLIETGTIEADTKLEIGEYSQTAISKMKELRLQGIFYKPGLFDAMPPLDRVSDMAAISFYKTGHFADNDYFHQKALLLKDEKVLDKASLLEELEKTDLGTVIRIKESEPIKALHKSPKSDGLEEIDLHIEEIVDDSREMSNGEIVSAQMARFETSLETALRAKTQKIVFIHGVGNGKLKHELRKTLDRKYPELKYQDASFREYGYGATLVYLK